MLAESLGARFQIRKSSDNLRGIAEPPVFMQHISNCLTYGRFEWRRIPAMALCNMQGPDLHKIGSQAFVTFLVESYNKIHYYKTQLKR